MRTALAALVAALALAGCGSREASVMKTAFDKPIQRADMELVFDVSASGGTEHVSVNGPYQSNGQGKLASFDYKVDASGFGPKAVDAEVISTGRDVFVVYRGRAYHVGAANLQRVLRQAGPKALTPADLDGLLGRMKSWFSHTSTQEDAQLDGEPTTRVSGRMDLKATLEGIAQITHQPVSSVRDLEQHLTDPRFAVDVGRTDGRLRQIEMEMADRSSGDVMEFKLRFRNLGRSVQIQTPAHPRPITALVRQFKGR
jgi:hypothetical protein